MELKLRMFVKRMKHNSVLQKPFFFMTQKIKVFVYNTYAKRPLKETYVYRLTQVNLDTTFKRSKNYPIHLQQTIHLLSASSVYIQQFYLHQLYGDYHIR